MNIQSKQKENLPMPTVKLGASRQIVIPKQIHDALGLEAGDFLEIEIYEGGKLLVTPKDLVDRHPEIDKRLAEAEADIKAGRVKGPFTTADAAIQALRGKSKKK
jgi:AbrB family looped-hinge helix DNA binding protein